jgi:hypothetical protein
MCLAPKRWLWVRFPQGTVANKLRVKISQWKNIFTLFYYIFLYAFPHSTMESRIGFRDLPKSLKAYSTLGGTSG